LVGGNPGGRQSRTGPRGEKNLPESHPVSLVILQAVDSGFPLTFDVIYTRQDKLPN
jgi:hypothetical protein